MRVCIISHNAYGVISGGQRGHIGGVEWQTTLTAKWLAARGHQVSMLTWTEGSPVAERFNEVDVLKICERHAGPPLIRFFTHKWRNLNRSLRDAAADVYYHNCGECFTGQIALWCRRNRKPFVFSAANDPDCDRHSKKLKTPVERWFYHYGLRRADYRIVQTQRQQTMLREGFGLDSEVIPMPCPSPTIEVPDRSGTGEYSRRVLWLARVCRQKRPDRLIEIARRNPDVEFDMVGPFDAADPYSREMETSARATPNITVHGRIPKDQVPPYFASARVFLSTSDFEGFPNTFLEAWSFGLPIVSTFDPDGVIQSRSLGLFAQDTDELSTALRRLVFGDPRYLDYSASARAYFNLHSVDTVLPRFEQVFLRLATRGA